MGNEVRGGILYLLARRGLFVKVSPDGRDDRSVCVHDRLISSHQSTKRWLVYRSLPMVEMTEKWLCARQTNLYSPITDQLSDGLCIDLSRWSRWQRNGCARDKLISTHKSLINWAAACVKISPDGRDDRSVCVRDKL